MTTYARTDQVRAFLYMQGVGLVDPDPLYYPVLGVEGLTRDLGDTTDVEVPSADRYGEYEVVDSIPGARGKATTSLTTRKPVGMPSALKRIADLNCPIDMHLNRGICDPPTDPNAFSELMIWEGVRVTNYSTSALASLASDGRESTTETVDISIQNAYEIYPMLYALTAAPSESSGAGKGILYAPSWCCNTRPCEILIAATGGHVYFVANGTSTDTAVTGVAGIAAVGNRIAIAQDAGTVLLKQYDKNGFTYTTTLTLDGTITSIDCIASNGRYGAVSADMIVQTFNATGTLKEVVDVTTLCGGAATKVSALSISKWDDIMVGVSDKGAVFYSQDEGANWEAATVLDGVTPVATAVCAITADTWLAGTTAGEIQMTDDRGVTWETVLDVTGTVTDIQAVSKHVAYATIGASLYRSVDGGSTWSAEPNVPGRTFVSMTSLAKIGACPDDMNAIALIGVTGGNARVVAGVPG